MIFVLNLPPLVWARWGFFALWFTALTGTALPVMYFLNLRFRSDPPAEPGSIVRQALWVGLYGCLIAWFQLGHVLAYWMWAGLAGGLAGVEYLIRLRERSQWHPPSDIDDQGSLRDDHSGSDDPYWLEGDESPR